MSVQLSSVLLGEMTSSWERTLEDIRDKKIAERIWEKDYTVWKPYPEEIVNRLGWLKSYEDFRDQWSQVEGFVTGVRGDGYSRALLLGMGGSSLAPEIFRRILGVREGYPDLSVCDTTAPGTIASLTGRLEIDKTLFIVSTKSGGTVETLSAMKYFFQLTCRQMEITEAGRHFLAITDPGSRLADMAEAYRFRHIFYGAPDIGGRYSALSVFGLVPAALIGADIKSLLKWTTDRHADAVMTGIKLGAMLGAAAAEGRNKATFVLSRTLAPFGDWVEQLIAESTGKEGKGILPVIGEPVGMPGVYGPDRIFVRIGLRGENEDEPGLLTLQEAGHPVTELVLDQVHDLAELLYVWEMATAVAGYVLAVNPFDQPDVEAAKQFTRQVIGRPQRAEAEEIPLVADRNMAVYGHGERVSDPAQALKDFLDFAGEGSYLAVQAYLAAEPSLTGLLEELRLAVRERFHIAATVGYGPRFLHSTGQLHKGDAGTGLFVQFTADNPEDIPIPDEMTGQKSSLTFGALQIAQARGDAKALESRGRRVLRFHLTGDMNAGIKQLIESLKR